MCYHEDMNFEERDTMSDTETTKRTIPELTVDDLDVEQIVRFVNAARQAPTVKENLFNTQCLLRLLGIEPAYTPSRILISPASRALYAGQYHTLGNTNEFCAEHFDTYQKALQNEEDTD